MIPGLSYVEDMQHKLIAVERKCERQERLITVYMNKNQDLWLALANIPGGLEMARKLGRPEL